MTNFFQPQPIPMTHNPEPAGYDLLRSMLMQRIFQQYANPYGLSPQGAANFGGFNQGSRPFNPYGGGSAGAGSGGQGMGGGMPSGGMGGSVGGAMPPPMTGGGGMQSMGQGLTPAGSGGGIGALIQMLLASRGIGGGQQMGGGQSMGGGMTPAGGGGTISSALQGSQPPSYQRPGGPSGQSVGFDGYSLGLGNSPIPGEQGYDGTTVGYGGMPMPSPTPPGGGWGPAPPPTFTNPWQPRPAPMPQPISTTPGGSPPPWRPGPTPPMPGPMPRPGFPSQPPFGGRPGIMPPSPPRPQPMSRGGFDGNTVGYGGHSIGQGGGAFQGFAPPQHQAQSVVALMRALGQVPRPHPMGMMRQPSPVSGPPRGVRM